MVVLLGATAMEESHGVAEALTCMCIPGAHAEKDTRQVQGGSGRYTPCVSECCFIDF